MPAVSNTSPVSNLAFINRLDLLKSQFSELCVPPAVATELKGHPDQAARATIEAGIHDQWLRIAAPQDTPLLWMLTSQVHAGESRSNSAGCGSQGRCPDHRRAGRKKSCFPSRVVCYWHLRCSIAGETSWNHRSGKASDTRLSFRFPRSCRPYRCRRVSAKRRAGHGRRTPCVSALRCWIITYSRRNQRSQRIGCSFLNMTSGKAQTRPNVNIVSGGGNRQPMIIPLMRRHRPEHKQHLPNRTAMIPPDPTRPHPSLGHRRTMIPPVSSGLDLSLRFHGLPLSFQINLAIQSPSLIKGHSASETGHGAHDS
jgi:hypothetical protein